MNKKPLGHINSYILRRISRNKNFMEIITGQTGSGKSWSALSQAETLDPNFTIENLCFTPKEFMDLVKGKTKPLKRGACIVWDELQVTMSNQDHQQLMAKMINSVLQTFRHRGFILIVTSPHFNFINRGARMLFHSRMETLGINYATKKVILKPFFLQVSQRKGDIYSKYLRVRIPGKGTIPVKKFKVGMPSKKLIKEYEKKKSEFTTKLNEDISRDMVRLGIIKKQKPLTQLQEQILERLKEGMNVHQVAEDLNRKADNIRTYLNYIRNKGWIISPVKEGKRVIKYTVKAVE